MRGLAVLGGLWVCSGATASACTAAPREAPSAMVSQATGACDYSVLTAHNDNHRTGAQTCETFLTPANAGNLRPQFTTWLDGLGDRTAPAQPLLLAKNPANPVNHVAQDALFVVTVGGYVYVLDPATLDRIFPPILVESDTNAYGINSTPVIDQPHNTLYLVARSTSGDFTLFAYDIDTMRPRGSWVLQGSNGNETFSNGNHRQRVALLLDHGHVYVGLGNQVNDEGHWYNGWVFAFNTVENGGGPAGPPYAVTRDSAASSIGMGGVWQMGAGLAADDAGNVYFGTGNGPSGKLGQPGAVTGPNNDGVSYVKLNGARWTGLPAGKYADPNPNFLNANDLDVSSTGMVVLPGPTPRVLGAGKQAIFTLLDTAGMAEISRERGAWNQYHPMLVDAAHVEPGSTVDCTAKVCDANLIPRFAPGPGAQSCCPNGCLRIPTPSDPFTGAPNYGDACEWDVLGSYPHVHGQPCYLNGTLFWWSEKDFPRFASYDPTSGSMGPIDAQASRVSASPSDRAPPNDTNVGGSPTDGSRMAFFEKGMPGGMPSLSANGASSAVLWALVPDSTDQGSAHELLKAFDVSNPAALPRPQALAAIDIGMSEYHTYPTIANGMVYATNAGCGSAGCSRDPVAGNVAQVVSYTACPGPGEAACSGRCAAVATDPYNCGGCVNVCPSGQSCSRGWCQPLRTFQAATRWSSYFCTPGEQCALGDVTGDGNDDLIAFHKAAQPQGPAPVYVGVSDGVSGFAGGSLWDTDFCGPTDNCTVAQVGGDSRADLVRFTASGEVHVALRVFAIKGSHELFTADMTWATGMCAGTVCTMADVNGDGLADVVEFVQGSSGTVYVALAGTNGFLPKTVWSDYFCTASEVCDVGDVDGDHRADVVAYNPNGWVWVALSGESDPERFGYPRVWSMPPGDACNAGTATNGTVCRIADLDGDGKSDLVHFTRGASPTMSVAYSTGAVFRYEQQLDGFFCQSFESCYVARPRGKTTSRSDVIAIGNDSVWVGAAP
jgi:hypothetical protein